MRRYRRVPKTPIKQAIRPCEEQVHVAHHPVGLPATEPDLAAITGGIIEVEATAKEPVGSQHVRVVEAVMVSTDVEERTEAVGPPCAAWRETSNRWGRRRRRIRATKL